MCPTLEGGTQPRRRVWAILRDLHEIAAYLPTWLEEKDQLKVNRTLHVLLEKIVV